jgi:hypothetical protein
MKEGKQERHRENEEQKEGMKKCLTQGKKNGVPQDKNETHALTEKAWRRLEEE